jgi:Uma2 family endonuclease
MVSTAPINRPLTVDDIADLPDDGMRYELIWGELYVSLAPGLPHQIASGNLSRILSIYLVGGGLGFLLTAPLDVQFDENNVVQPDLLVVATEN